MNKSKVDELNSLSEGYFPGLIGVNVLEWETGRLLSALKVRRELIAPNEYLHAATVVGLADTTCGYGTRSNLPEGAVGFTTIELKCNFIGTALEGEILCEATLEHGGRMTQVWNAVIKAEESGRELALFRCTQMLFYNEPTK